MGSPQGFPKTNTAAGPNYVKERQADQVGIPVQGIAAPLPLVQNSKGKILEQNTKGELPQVNTNSENHGNMVEKHQETAAPQESETSQDFDALNTKQAIDIVIDLETSNENYKTFEQLPVEIFDQTSIDPNNSQTTKLLTQTSNEGFVEFLANSKTNEANTEKGHQNGQLKIL